MSRLSSKQRKGLPAGAFAGPGRSFPMNDKAHIDAAVREEKFASPATRSKINARARAAGVNVGGDGKTFADHHQATTV
jgi:hypothetical protein